MRLEDQSKSVAIGNPSILQYIVLVKLVMTVLHTVMLNSDERSDQVCK